MVIVYVLATHGGIMRLRTASTVTDAASERIGKVLEKLQALSLYLIAVYKAENI